MHRPLIIVLFVAFLAGCIAKPKIETAADLAEALKQNGIAYADAEPADVNVISFAKIDEGLTLYGENLNVTILRITDPRTYKLATSATFILGFVKSVAPEMPDQPPDVYLSTPFAIVIRAEPAEGAVRAALEKIIPEDVDEP